LNVELARMLAVNTILPVLLVQMTLHRAGMRWLYTLGITVLVTVLATAIDSRDLIPSPQILWQHFHQTEAIAACGGNPSPKSYCAATLWHLQAALPFISPLPMAYVVVPWLLADAVWVRLDRRWELWARVKPRLERHYRWLRFAVGAACHGVWIGLQLAVGGCMIMYLFDLRRVVQAVLQGNSPWTYGQLVAVMVWVPIVSKYAYFNICEFLVLVLCVDRGNGQ
jgi:hypothetical protein